MARADAADEAFGDAKSAYAKLKGDAKRRSLRHHWQNVAKKFEAVARKYPKSDRAPEALFDAAELDNELSRFSGNSEDRDAAERNYQKLISTWPRHKLCDDAAFSLARLLADREGDTAGARRVLEDALKNAGDKKKDMQAMLAALPKDAKATAKKDDEPATKRADAKDTAKDAPSKADGKDSKDAGKDKRAEKVAKAEKRDAPEPPAKPARPPEDKEPPAVDVAEAIRRAIRPLEGVAPRADEGPLTAQARRLPPSRPADDDGETRATDDVDEGDESVAASLAERLRDVRVGAKGKDKVEEGEARNRLAKLAKTEGVSDLSLAQQLGLKVRRVIIDAGHGGHDTGAIGPGGTREKDIALAIAKKLAARLEAAGLEVLLTRDDDTFVKLEDRTRFANRQKGDLFISIHCNSAPTKTLRGVETYTLNTSSNRYSIRLAARENATTERGVGDLQYILADLATKANTGESSRLAERVQKSIVHNLSEDYKGVKDLGTKEALFFVLLGARMPAILVETSFLSHPEEEQRLADEEYQDKIADSINEAVGGFLEDRNKIAQVD
ncbi:MAG: N-acetylmuramoyl-L-alanine amidase [Myxococcaceae bacterium]